MKKIKIVIVLFLLSASAMFAQVQYTTGGSANAFTLAYPANITTLTAGLSFTFKANHTITGAATLNINGLGAVSIKKEVSNNLAANDIVNGQIVIAVYDGTNFQMITIPGSPSGGPPTGAAGGDLSGTYPNPTVARLQGRNVNSSLPTDLQYLGWNNGLSQWEPKTLPIASADWTLLGNTLTGTEKLGSTNGFDVPFYANNLNHMTLTQKGTLKLVSSVGTNNIFIGNTSAEATTTGISNIFIGTGAGGSNIGGANNVFIGNNGGVTNTSGNANVFIGSSAGQSNTTALSNVFIGFQSGFSNLNGGSNTFIGREAGRSNVAGTFNTALGRDALRNSTGSNNTANGYQALLTNTTGSNNTALGYNADVTVNNLSNATAIGYNAKVDASNALVLGGTGADAVNVGIGTTSPTQTFSVAEKFQVDINGNIVKLNNVTTTFPAANAAGVLTNNGSGTLTWAAGGGISGSGTVNTIPKFTPTGTSLGNSAINDDGTRVQITSFLSVGAGSPPTTQKIYAEVGAGSDEGIRSVNFGTGKAGLFEYNNTGGSADAVSITTNGNNSKALNVSHTGTTGFSPDYGVYSTTTGARGATSVNVGGYFSASGANNNYAGIFDQGNVGIGITSPSYPLDVLNGGTTTQLRVGNSVNKYMLFGADGGGSNAFITGYNNGNTTQIYFENQAGNSAYLGFLANGSEKMRVNGAGNVGVGTTSPQSSLHVVSPATASTKILQLGNFNQPSYEWHFDVNGTTSDMTLVQEYAGAPKTSMYWDANTGFVAFGNTAAPSPLTVGTASQFQVNTSGNIIKLNNVATSFPAANAAGVLTNDGTGTLTWAAAGGGITMSCATNNYLTKRTSASDIGCSQIFDNGTNVAIGTATPGALFHVYKNVSNATPEMQVENSVSNGTSEINLKTSGGALDQLEILKGGPTASGSIDGINIAALSAVSAGAQAAALMLRTVTNNPIYFLSNNLTRMTILGTGNVGIGTTGPLSKLDVNGGIAVGTYAGTTAAPANGMIISGQVGIGISPAATNKLDVLDAINNGAAIHGKSTATGASGVWGEATNTNGTAVYGKATGTAFAGVYGSATAGINSGYFLGGNGFYVQDRVGIGTTTPTTSFQTTGGVSMPLFIPVANIAPLDQQYYTIVFPAGNGNNVTLPAAAATNNGWIYVIVNHSGGGKIIGNYTDISNAVVNTVVNNTSVMVQSSGAAGVWYQIK